MLSRIHVRRDRIAFDNKNGTSSLVFGVETRGQAKRYGRRVYCEGPVAFIYSPNKPLKCGAKAWAETMSPVKVFDR